MKLKNLVVRNKNFKMWKNKKNNKLDDVAYMQVKDLS